MSYCTHLFFEHLKDEDMKALKLSSIPAEASVPHTQDLLPVLPPPTPGLMAKTLEKLNNYRENNKGKGCLSFS